MAERPLRGAIQKDGKLTEGSVNLLRASGIPFELPTERQRWSEVRHPYMWISTEKNGDLAKEVAKGKYDWGIAGRDTVYALPDNLLRQIRIVEPDLGFAYCYYVLGVYQSQSENRPELNILVDRSKGEVQSLEDLKPGTKIATKYEHALNRLIREEERRLKRPLLLDVKHEGTPETAPAFSFNNILVVADIWERGNTFLTNFIEPRITLFDSQAVLIRRIYRFSKANEESFRTLHDMIKEGLTRPESLSRPQPPSPDLGGMTDGHERPNPLSRLWPFAHRGERPQVSGGVLVR